MENYPTDESSIDKLEETLMGEMQDDSRLTSGSGTSTGDSDLDFINMTGLVAPVMTDIPQSSDENLTVDYAESDLNPEAPVSFYEEGVDDVDTSMDPANTSILDEEVIGLDASSDGPEPASAALAGLQEIILELTQDNSADASEETAVERNFVSDQQETHSPSDGVEVEAMPDDTAVEIEAGSLSEVDDLASINLEAASAALEDLDLSQDESGADDVDVSNLISSIDFGETESLLEELETQKRDAPASMDVPEPQDVPEVEVIIEPDAESSASEQSNPDDDSDQYDSIFSVDLNKISSVLPDDANESDASVYSKAPLPKIKPRHKRRRSFGANALVFLIVLAFMIGSIGFAYFTLRQYVQRSLTPQELYSEGLALLNEGSYRKAASHFADFTRSYPSDQRRGDAEFMAAYALQLSPATRRSETVQIYNEALVKFESFIASNPTHGKAARARTIAGILHYKLDNYEEAIQILSDPELRLADSAGFIPGLRTLARAYAANYDIENAELTFMKVARLKDNISPANDYIELAALYANLTRNTIEDATRADYLKKSIELWDLAIRVPTLLSAKKRTLIATRDAALGELAELDPAMVVPRTSKIESNPIPVSTPNTDLDLDSLRLPDDAQ